MQEIEEISESQYVKELEFFKKNNNQQTLTALNQDEPNANEVNQPDADQDGACQPQSLSSRIRQSLTSAWTGLKRFFCCLKTAN